MIDPRISLAAQAPQFGVGSAINIFENALMNSQTRDLRQKQEARVAELAPLQLQNAQQGVESNQQAINQNRDTQRLTSIHQTGQRLKPILLSGDTQAAQKFMLDNISQLQTRIEQGSGEDIAESMDVLAKIQAGDVQGALADIDAVEGLVNRAGQTARQREFSGLTKHLTPEQLVKAKNIELGLTPRASISANERIAGDPLLTADVAESQATIAGAKATATEGGKLTQQRKHKPEITRAVKLAEKEANERGDTLTALQRSKAALPGLTQAVDQLRDLSVIATSTFGGKLFDGAVKQTGFGSTKGATARAKFIAIVNNQVLPLLKETFGAAFTATEGEALKATMGDPDASPDEKMAQLDAFIDQKARSIETNERQLEQTAVNDNASLGGTIMTDANGNRARVFDDGTFEEL